MPKFDLALGGVYGAFAMVQTLTLQRAQQWVSIWQLAMRFYSLCCSHSERRGDAFMMHYYARRYSICRDRCFEAAKRSTLMGSAPPRSIDWFGEMGA